MGGAPGEYRLMGNAPRKELILVADPMCSWCWGFAPAMAAIRRDFGHVVGISLVVGGLRPGTTEAMTDSMKGEIRHHWQHVNEASGQPFDMKFFDRDGFVYDTEPACRAAACVRDLEPEAALDFLETLHRAFYAENQDITNADVVADLAAGSGLDRQQFADSFDSDQARKNTLNDFSYARSLGVTGFPTIVAHDTGDDGEGQYAYLTVGYRPYDAIKPLLEEWTGKF